MQTIKLHHGAHRSHSGIGEESRSVARVPAAEAFRYQHLNFLSEQFFLLIAKYLFNLRIYEYHLPLAIHDHHGVGSSLQQTAEHLVCPFSLTDVLKNAREICLPIHFPGGKGDAEWNFRSVLSNSRQFDTFSDHTRLPR